jgi:tRNA A-37 threonylcarbamoyl transferase component Bud32
VEAIRGFLERAGLIPPGSVPRFEPLGGGVSSDIWLVRAGTSEFCVKRALGRLRVAADWRVDESRNLTEVRWLTQVGTFNVDLVPAVLASDPSLAVFAMEFLPPDRHELWKSQLARGCVMSETAAAVGRCLASIHSAFAKSPTAAADFNTGALFHALRIEPYLLATASAHPDLARVLESLATRTAQTTRTVVHGDISPKNILIGARGPVFLDAECAWFGDPAFDLAFCLNHLLLKTLWVPMVQQELLASFDALTEAYLRGVDWEPAAALEERAAHLLPALFLARVDGKSPVEYLTDDASKNTVRYAARAMLQQPTDKLSEVRRTWHTTIALNE